MHELTIQLTEALKEFVDEQISSGEYPSTTDFINYLLREEQKRRAKEYLTKIIREAEASGEPEEITPAYWDEVRRTFRQKCGQDQGQP
jgi:antitoxin ParD1/3/4